MEQDINLSVQDRVAVIELNRPASLNAITLAMRRELHAVVDRVGCDPAVGAVVLAGAGKSFCSGADLKAAADQPDRTLRRTARTLIHDFQPTLEAITRMDKPVIAAVQGGAVGIGMSLALSCDFLVMASDAYLLAPFVNMGLIADGGAAWLLTRRIGYGRALELLIESKKLDAAAALQLGVANRVAEGEALRDQAVEWAARLARRAPLAAALSKRMARMSLTIGFSEALTMEAELQTFLAGSEDVKEGIAAFSQKRPPNFQGR